MRTIGRDAVQPPAGDGSHAAVRGEERLTCPFVGWRGAVEAVRPKIVREERRRNVRILSDRSVRANHGANEITGEREAVRTLGGRCERLTYRPAGGTRLAPAADVSEAAGLDRA